MQAVQLTDSHDLGNGQIAACTVFVLSEKFPLVLFVEGMGMDWKTQFRKLQQRFKGCVVEMTTQLPGDSQRRNVVCLPLRKLAGWLQTISPNKG